MASIQYYFIQEHQVNEKIITMNESDSKHLIKVMRSQTGDKVNCVISGGIKYECQIHSMNKIVELEILQQTYFNNELPYRITLVYGLPKLEKFELVLQKAVELGVTKVIPCLTKRSIIKLDQDRSNKKMSRWQLIIKEAAEQSHRSYLPEIMDVTTIKKLSFNTKHLLVAYENNEDQFILSKTIKSLENDDEIVIFIGPEGGFDETEIDELTNKGFIPCSLGKRILRTETAAIFALSAIMYQSELRGE